MDRAPLLVLSHLRWDVVVQRPQHLMTRIAGRRDVLFVDEPTPRPGGPNVEIREVAPRLKVCRVRLPVAGAGFGEAQRPVLEPLLRNVLDRLGWTDFAAWLYTPAAVRLALSLEPRAMLYDCVEEPSMSPHASPELLLREQELLARADVVFTAGPSLFRAKRDRHPFVRCFPNSVDVGHFTSAGPRIDPRNQAGLPRPRLGYCGVIDERIDLRLIDALARRRPDASIVLVGPVERIDPSSLPRRPNVHVLGPRPYADLPSYLAGWDACLLPFAIRPATRTLNPIQLLEYLAADRPVVSTPLPDVLEPYAEIVHFGEGDPGFDEACGSALEPRHGDREARRSLTRSILRRTSWDETARRMDEILHYVADSGQARVVAMAEPLRA